MPRDTLQTTAQRMSVKPVSKLALHWQAVDGLAERIRRHLRPLYVALDLAGTDPGSPWLVALAWPRTCSPNSSAYRNGRSPNVQRPRCRNACDRTC
jgi:hypothetical protein